MPVERTVRLHFEESARAAGTHTNLSAVRSDGAALWVAGDETATVERLLADDPREPRRFAEQTSFHLADYVPLPAAAPDEDDEGEEADIEGLARHGPFLWAVGSHSLRRKQIKGKHTGEKAFRRLAQVSGQRNRQLLLRFPVTAVDGVPTIVRELDLDGVHIGPPRSARTGPTCGSSWPPTSSWARSSRCRARTTAWTSRASPSRAPGVPRPARSGPARLGDGPGAPARGRPRRPGPTAAPALRRRPPLPQARPEPPGAGRRDLCPHGDDLLVLAGPTTELDGPVHVFRWHGALRADQPQVVRDDLLTRELSLPFGEADDHAEGIGLVGAAELLVVYDSPSATRLNDDGDVLADVVRLPVRHVSPLAPPPRPDPPAGRPPVPRGR